jgi:hypothetical protein
MNGGGEKYTKRHSSLPLTNVLIHVTLNDIYEGSVLLKKVLHDIRLSTVGVQTLVAIIRLFLFPGQTEKQFIVAELVEGSAEIYNSATFFPVIKPHEYFQVEKLTNDLIYQIYVDDVREMINKQITILLLDGSSLTVTIPLSIIINKKFVIKNKGMQYIDANGEKQYTNLVITLKLK